MEPSEGLTKPSPLQTKKDWRYMFVSWSLRQHCLGYGFLCLVYKKKVLTQNIFFSSYLFFSLDSRCSLWVQWFQQVSTCKSSKTFLIVILWAWSKPGQNFQSNIPFFFIFSQSWFPISLRFILGLGCSLHTFCCVFLWSRICGRAQVGSQESKRQECMTAGIWYCLV